MKDPMVAIALAGTSRQERVEFVTGTPVDALLKQLPEGEVERAFLLGAGVWALYRLAGAQSQQMDEVLEPCAPETRRECSPGAALLVSRLLAGEQSELLPEALGLMNQQDLRLPFRLLPQALNTTNKETRAALFSLLGERGRWLSQFNPAWKWVNQYLVGQEEGLPVDAENIWQEGTAGQRVEILRRLRALEPEKARAWLQAVWKQEKAEVRSEFLAALKPGLSAADEPFLEQALDDRAASVRACAVDLLSALPASAFSARMRQRAQSMVRLIDGQINIEPPGEFPQDWQRDGLSEKPPAQFSPRAWWLLQVVALVEPSFWEDYLGAAPARLLTMFSTDDVWRVQMIEGWSKASRRYGTEAWLEPLWSWWHAHYQETIEKNQLSEYSYADDLLGRMPGPMAEHLALRLMLEATDNEVAFWPNILPGLPQPWSATFARTYLRFLRENCAVEKIEAEHFNAYNNAWITTLHLAARALPAACLSEAAQGWDLRESSTWQFQYAMRQIKEFIEIVHLREKIYEEIN